MDGSKFGSVSIRIPSSSLGITKSAMKSIPPTRFSTAEICIFSLDYDVSVEPHGADKSEVAERREPSGWIDQFVFD